MTGHALLADYVVPDGHFDEVRSADGALRDPWAEFAATTELRSEHLSQVQKRVARQIEENGVTYSVYATADGSQRPWSLDVLPLIVGAQEWESLERGLRQRARLLNAMAADLYGPQTLLRDGLLPPALVFRHQGFLRACHGVRPADGVFLHLVAFDLARGADGEWRVVGTRTQAPSGVGYALENRAIISRVLPGHVTLAWGRDYGDVSPLRGVVLGGRDHTLHVGVSVTPASEDDRSPVALAVDSPSS